MITSDEIPIGGSQLTERQKLIIQLDAAALGDANFEVRESRRPGAIATLRDWAGARGLKIEEHDLRHCGGDEIWHEVVLSPCHVIVVRERAA